MARLGLSARASCCHSTCLTVRPATAPGLSPRQPACEAKASRRTIRGWHYFLGQLRTHRWRARSIAALRRGPIVHQRAAAVDCGHVLQRNAHQSCWTRRRRRSRRLQYARHLGADHILVCNSWKLLAAAHQAPWSKQGQLPNDYFRHTFRNAIVGTWRRGWGDAFGSFWRCSVVSPATANYDQATAHLRAPGSAERDVSFYFQGGANNRGTMGYAFRQAVLAQLDGFPRAHISAFSLPGQPAPCRGSATTNCRAGRSNPAFRSLMARAKYNLVLRGDSPSSRRLYDGIAAGAVSVLVSDELWSVGLPFTCLIPWRKMALTLSERPFVTREGAASTLHALDALSPNLLARMQRLANRHRRDLLWNINGSRVAENLLITSALRCLPSHVTRRAAATRTIERLAASARHGDHSVHAARPTRRLCRLRDGRPRALHADRALLCRLVPAL